MILGKVGANVGAGMTGGKLFIRLSEVEQLNSQYLQKSQVTESDWQELKILLQDYLLESGSKTAQNLLENWESLAKKDFVKCLPLKHATQALSGTMDKPLTTFEEIVG